MKSVNYSLMGPLPLPWLPLRNLQGHEINFINKKKYKKILFIILSGRIYHGHFISYL